MDRAKKAAEISGLSERFGRAKASFLVDFKGMTVEQVTNLRRQLFPLGAEMRVVRNTLAKRALKDHPDADEVLSSHFVGTNAIVFSYGDVGVTAKTLSEFSKDVEHLELKRGIMDGKALDRSKIDYLATLPPKEVLQAQFLALLSAPASKFVRVLNEVPSGFVRVLNAKKEKSA
jgi:large subunit ribosomal protein L10